MNVVLLRKMNISITVENLRKKYPRLCRGVTFHSESAPSPPQMRSGLWLCRFIEECYDEACNTYSGISASGIRNRIDFTVADPFPVIIGKLFAHRYSVLEVRERILLDFLLTLERYSSSELSYSFEGEDSTDVALNCTRANLFSRFLSEEYDNQICALFLYSREIFQIIVGHKHRDILQPFIWTDNLKVGNFQSTKSPVLNEVGDRLQSTGNNGITEKITPVALPTHWTFVPDAVIIDAPLLCFDLSMVSKIISTIFPEASLTTRAYLTNKILEFNRQLYQKARAHLCGDSSAHLKSRLLQSTPISLQGFFESLMWEWKNCPYDHREKFKEGKTNSDLKRLNMIYDNDCALTTDLATAIKDTGVELSTCEALILQLEKKCRRLERRWNSGLADEAELDELQQLRVSLTEAQAEKIGLAGKLQALKSKEKSIGADVSSLWSSVLSSSATSAPGRRDDSSGMKRHLNISSAVSWRESVVPSFLAAVGYNERRQDLMRGDRETKDEALLAKPKIKIKLNKKSLSTLKSRKTLGTEEPPKASIVVKKKKIDIHSEHISTHMTIDAAVSKPPDSPSSAMPAESTAIEEEAVKRVEVLKSELGQFGARSVQILAEAVLSQDVNRSFPEVLGDDAEMAKMQRRKVEVMVILRERLPRVLDSAVKWIRQAAEDKLGPLPPSVLRDLGTAIDDFRDVRVLQQFSQWMSASIKELEPTICVLVSQLVESVTEELDKRDQEADLSAALIRKAAVNTAGYCVSHGFELVAIARMQAILEARRREEELREEEERRQQIKAMIRATAKVEYGAIFFAASHHATSVLLEQDNALNNVAHQLIDDTIRDFFIPLVQAALKEMDPWVHLDLEPEELVDSVTMEMVYLKSAAYHSHLVYDVFAKMKASLRSGAVRAISARYIFQNVRKVYDLSVMHRWAVTRVQLFMRHLYRRLRRLRYEQFIRIVERYHAERQDIAFRNMFVYLKYLASCAQRARAVTANMKERRLMITYFTLKTLHISAKNERVRILKAQAKAVLIIQCRTRMFAAKRHLKKLRLQLVMSPLARGVAARRSSRAIRDNMRRLAEYSLVLTASPSRCRRGLVLFNSYWSLWKRAARHSQGLHLLFRLYIRNVSSQAFFRLRSEANKHKAFLGARVIKIQSILRMHLIKRNIVDYYRWRRGLKRLQGLARMMAARKYFIPLLFVYRNARTIQSGWRGFRTRKHLTESRIIAIHYAAANNNYERLMYFVRKYPELLNELDERGNSALHNAASSGARRTLKLLLKHNLDPNALNFEGYSPLHLVIMSSSVNRDDCCLYMLELGLFDEDQSTSDGKTCLLLACEYGRTFVCSHLIKTGIDPGIPDNNGTTCLQAAAMRGHRPIVRMLLDVDADVNRPGFCGTYPLHDCVVAGDVDIAKMLLKEGAKVNVEEPYHLHTPMMWACMEGQASIAALYLLEGANAHAEDQDGRTVAHHAAASNNVKLYDILRDADLDFEKPDNEGNTPLHVAVMSQSVAFVECLLHAAVYPSPQNNVRDQPSHIAARLNNVEILRLLSKYDKHMGRINFAHQTPLGVAKFYFAEEAVAYLHSHFDREMNEAKEILWDGAAMDALDGWSVQVSGLGERVYVFESTGDTSALPPVLSVDVVETAAPLNEHKLRKVTKQVVDDVDAGLTSQAYFDMHKDETAELRIMKIQSDAATVMATYARRRLARRLFRAMKKLDVASKIIARFFRRCTPHFYAMSFARRTKAATRLQAVVRGFVFRTKFHEPDEKTGRSIYGDLAFGLTQRKARLVIWAFWKKHNRERMSTIVGVIMSMPKDHYAWQLFTRRLKARRRVGVYQEFRYPHTRSVYIYRHDLTGVCTFKKPAGLAARDLKEHEDALDVLHQGYTRRQRSSAIRLQACWRGYSTRHYYDVIAQAINVSLTAETKYLDHPNSEQNLFNYMVYCFVVKMEFDHARELFTKALLRMEQRGPDLPFVLYSYAVFAFVVHDLDYHDIMQLVERARKAELKAAIIDKKKLLSDVSAHVDMRNFSYGKSFDFATIGFFKRIALEQPSMHSWHSYAACCFLVLNDFKSSFDAFLNAFRFEPGYRKLKENFDLMLEYFHGFRSHTGTLIAGADKSHIDDITISFMMASAEKAIEIQNREIRRYEQYVKENDGAKTIQSFYKSYKLWRDIERRIELRLGNDELEDFSDKSWSDSDADWS